MYAFCIWINWLTIADGIPANRYRFQWTESGSKASMKREKKINDKYFEYVKNQSVEKKNQLSLNECAQLGQWDWMRLDLVWLLVL